MSSAIFLEHNRPVVRVIGLWFTVLPLCLVDVAFGKGRAIVCGFMVEGGEAEDSVSRQVAANQETCMRSDAFRPQIMVTDDQLRSHPTRFLERNDFR